MVSQNLIATGGSTGGGIWTWIMVGLLVVLVIFLLVVPMFTNKKRAKQVMDLHNSLQPGDVIKTVGGIIGTVKAVNQLSPVDREMIIETGEGDNKTTMRLDIQALYQVMSRANSSYAGYAASSNIGKVTVIKDDEPADKPDKADAPVEDKAEKVDAPVETPVETPVEAPVEAPAEPVAEEPAAAELVPEATAAEEPAAEQAAAEAPAAPAKKPAARSAKAGPSKSAGAKKPAAKKSTKSE